MKPTELKALVGKSFQSKDKSDSEAYQCARVIPGYNFGDSRGVQDAVILLHPSDASKIVAVMADDVLNQFDLVADAATSKEKE